MRARTAAVLLFVLTMPLAAGAQAADPDAKSDPKDTATQPSQGPMTLERVHDGFTLGPDFKATRFGSSSSTGWLGGGYGGWIFDDTLLIGGGGYWLMNDTSAVRDFGYGGAVVQWLQRGDRSIGYGARGLVGF